MGLEPYVLDLEVDGLTVVPPEVHGVSEAEVDLMVELILARAEQMVGCGFSLEDGPLQPVMFASNRNTLASFAGEQGETSQFLVQKLGSHHRAFRDLAVNPVAVALMRHLARGVSPENTRHAYLGCQLLPASDGHLTGGHQKQL
jgi:hypothetical protein